MIENRLLEVGEELVIAFDTQSNSLPIVGTSTSQQFYLLPDNGTEKTITTFRGQLNAGFKVLLESNEYGHRYLRIAEDESLQYWLIQVIESINEVLCFSKMAGIKSCQSWCH